MSKGSTAWKVIIDDENDEGRVTEQLNNSVKAINIESRIVAEENIDYDIDENETETSDMSMTVDDLETGHQSYSHANNLDGLAVGGRESPLDTSAVNTSKLDESASEALDLSFIPCSIPLKKRKISSLPSIPNGERIKLDYNHHRNHHPHSHQHRLQQHHNHKHHLHQQTQPFNHQDLISTSLPTTSAFNQLTNNRLNSFSLQSSKSPQNHFPFTLRALPSASGSSSELSSNINCKPLSLVKNEPLDAQQQHQYPHNIHHQLQQQQQHVNHQLQHQKLIQYHQQQHQQLQFNQRQKQQIRVQDFTNGTKSTLVGSSPSGQTKGMSCRRPGFITCSICNATKYYSHVQRRFGQYSCEPCSKFMKRFLRDPKIFTCSQKGHCTIGKPSGEQEPRGVSVNRCKACWLKICLEKFILDSETRVVIDKYYAPKFSDSSGLPSTEATDLLGGGSGGGGGGGGDGESEGGSECSNNLSTISSGNSGGGGRGGRGSVDLFGGESKEVVRIQGKILGDGSGIGSGGEGVGRTVKSSKKSGLSDRIETNGCDTTISSPPPLPFPQRKRKPKNETSISPLLSVISSSSSSLSTQVTTTTTTPGNLINNNNNNSNGSTIAGESIPLSTSLSGNNSCMKDKHHPHPLHHSHQNQQYHSSFYGGSHLSTASPSVSGGRGHLSTEPLCLTTSGRRSDISSSGLLGNLSSNRSSSYFSGGHLSLTSASLGPRYPWSHRRKDDYDLLAPSTNGGGSLTIPISFRRDLTRSFHHDNLMIRRGSDDDINDLYSCDYSLTSPELLLSGPYVGVSHIIKDSNGDPDDNVTVMGSPATPPPPPARCGKCTYCLPTIDEKANVVVVKENVGPVRCRLAEMMSKISQPNDIKGGRNEETEGGVTTTTTTTITAKKAPSTPSATTSTASSQTEGNLLVTNRGVKRFNIKRSLSATSKGDEDNTDEGQNTEDGVHSSTPTLHNNDNNKNNGRRNRKERRGQSREGTGLTLCAKEESDSTTTTISTGGSGGGGIDDDDMNDGENEDRVDVKGNSKDALLYRKRLIPGDDDDNIGTASIRYLNHDENHLGHHNNYINNHLLLNHHQGNNNNNRSTPTSSSSSSASTNNTTTSNNKLNKSGLFNSKPYKKILINEHFVNSSPSIINNQSASNTIINSNNPLSSRDLSVGSMISPDSNFLSEILNANSPFL